MSPLSLDLTLVENYDSIRVTHCADAVSHYQDRPVLHLCLQRILDQLLSIWVDAAGSLVEYEYLWVNDEGTS